MRLSYVIAGLAAICASAAYAGSQSSNTSSNSSSNNGVVRERVVDTYCSGGYCERRVERRVYRDDRGQRRYRGDDRRRYREAERRRYREYRDHRRDDDD